MSKKYFRAIVCLSILGGNSCTNSKGIRIPDPKYYELSGTEFFLILKSGEIFKADKIQVKNDTVYFKESAIPIGKIKTIETRSFSPLKTLGLLAGISSAVVVAGVSYVYYAMAYGRASEK